MMTKVVSAAVLFRCVSSDQILWKDEAKVCVIIIWIENPVEKKLQMTWSIGDILCWPPA